MKWAKKKFSLFWPKLRIFNDALKKFFIFKMTASIFFFQSFFSLKWFWKHFKPSCCCHECRKIGNNYRLSQGFSNFICWRPLYLFLEILRAFKVSCDPIDIKIYHNSASIWVFIGQIDLKAIIYVQSLAALFWKLATLERVATP